MLFGRLRARTLHLLALVMTALVMFAACGSSAPDEPAGASASDEPAAPTEVVAESAQPTETAAEAASTTETAAEPTEVAVDPPAGDGLFPTVVDATASTSDGVDWRVAVTLLSEYDSPERYADAWRVLDGDDNELGIRVLAHDHANEQPFTRSHGVAIPAELDIVFIEGRDQVNGWSGERFPLELER